MYQKLLLNCEGGIIDVTQQCEQDNCAVVCIGLGGTGTDCLKNLKAKIYNRVQPDEPNSAVPSYSHIKFLAVDTDKTGLVHANEKASDITKIDLDTEFFDISYQGDISDLFKENGPTLDNKPEYKEWLRHYDIRVTQAKAGAGGVRQLGRYLLMEHAADFVAKVSSLVTQSMSGLTTPKTYVHIFSGMGGGTGAGTFLDVCYLVQEAIRKNRANSFVCGYFFLPDVNIANNLPRETEENVKETGYASMQDLNYCMNLERNGDKWVQSYSGIGTIETTKPPVDICHLVSARDAKGNVIPGAYNYAMNVVTDYFMDFIAKTEANFTMESHIANYVAVKSKVYKEYGAEYEYCVLGASTATLPFKEVLTYLTSEMFDRISSIRNNVPTKGQLDEFIAKNGLKYDAISAQLTQKCDMTFPVPDVKWDDAKGNDDLTVTYFTDIRARVNQSLETNYAAMSRDLENYQSVAGNNVTTARSLVAKILTALRAEAVNPDRGPFYAAAMLRSTSGTDLISVVDGYLAEVRNKYSQENIQEDRLRPAWEQAQRDFFENANRLNGRRKYTIYRDATRRLEIHYTRLDIFGKMEDLLTKLRKQLVDLADKFMDVFRNVTQNLIDTFAENRRYLDSMADSAVAYEFPLAKIQGLKESLKIVVKEMDVKVKATDFLQSLLSEEGIKAWINGSENDIFIVVNRYFTTLFSEYSHKTMTSYLQDKYHTVVPAQLTKCVRDDIMNTLDGNATPLFWTAPLYNVSRASSIGYVTFPAVSSEVSAAAVQLSASKPTGMLIPRASKIQDRISIMRCLVGVPLYGYQGLLQYEKTSVNQNTVGKHPYEGKPYINDNGEKVEGRNWTYLPSPAPLSLMNNDNAEILKKNAEEAKSLYERAEAKKIIRNTDANNYGIFIITQAFMAQIRDIKQVAMGKTKVEQLEAIDKIKELMDNVQFEADKIKIPNDATGTLPEFNKRLVRIDHFAAAPILQKKVLEELAKYDEIDRILNELEPKEDVDLALFQNALYTGVIKFAPPTMSCEDEYGTEYSLSSPEMKRGGVPLYQGFLKFKELDEGVRNFLKEQSDQVLRTLPLCDEAKDACHAVDLELKGLKFMVQEATELFPAEVPELKKFLNALRESLPRFARRYRFDL